MKALTQIHVYPPECTTIDTIVRWFIWVHTCMMCFGNNNDEYANAVINMKNFRHLFHFSSVMCP